MAKQKVKKQTSRHWAAQHEADIIILERLGWSKGFFSWAVERITLEEFKKRVNNSVVEIKNPKFLQVAKVEKSKSVNQKVDKGTGLYKTYEAPKNEPVEPAAEA